MTELMRSLETRFNSGAFERPSDDLVYVAAVLQAPYRGPRPQKDPAAGRRRPSAFQIGCNGATDVEGQRQWPFLAAFPVNAQTSASPVDIVELKKNDFPCA